MCNLLILLCTALIIANVVLLAVILELIFNEEQENGN